MENRVSRNIDVLLADGHQMFIQAVALILACEGDLNIVGPVATADATIEAVQQHHIDVVVMDQHLIEGNGLDTASDLLTRYPDLRIVVMTAEPSRSVAQQSLQAGCWGYLSWSENIRTLAPSIRAVNSGTMLLSPSVMMNDSRVPDAGLTLREMETLQLLANGLSTTDIAERLSLQPSTVRNHTQAVLEKLGAHSRLEAVTTAARRGLLPDAFAA